MKNLLAAIRESATQQVWSRGVALSRQNLVQGENISADEITVRVSVPGRFVASRVTLWPSDEDWNCDCTSDLDPCEHVAAAAIAAKQAKDKGSILPTLNNRAAIIGYRFVSNGGNLDFYRSIQEGDLPEKKLSVSLVALKMGRVSGPVVSPSKEDLAFELLLKHNFDGIFSKAIWLRLAETLSKCSGLKLDGKDIKFSTRSAGPVAIVEDDSGGIRIRGGQNPSITKVFLNGVALCGAELRIINDGGLTSDELEMLRLGRFFGGAQKSFFISEVLPALQKKIEIVIKTDRPLAVSDALPRVVVDASSMKAAHKLKVDVQIFYGNPSVAIISENKLKMIADAPIPRRNQFLEEKLQSQALTQLGLKPGESHVFEGENAVNFANKLRCWRGEVIGDGLLEFAIRPDLRPTVTVEANDFSIHFIIIAESEAIPGVRIYDGSDGQPRDHDTMGNHKSNSKDFDYPRSRISSHVEPQEVLNAWTRGDTMIPLRGGGWAPIPLDWLSKYGDKIKSLLVAREATKGFAKSMVPEIIEICRDLDEDIPAEWKDISNVIENFSSIDRFDLPHDLTVDLREYQKTGVKWLRFLLENNLGGILADDMGLGKTLQAISVMTGRILVVAPTSVIHNWRNEIEKFRPHLSSCVYHGAKRSMNPATNVIITTYAIMRIEIEKFSSEHWDMVILDEAQNIKNPDSKAARAAYALQANFRLTLSGTPIENSLEELWSQMNFVNPGLLGSRKAFQREVSKKIDGGDQHEIARFQAKIRPFILRRKKVEVASELPARTTTVIRCELDVDERRLYESLLLSARKDVIEMVESGGSVFKALEMLLRLRQASCHRALVPGETAESSSKLVWLRENLENTLAAGHKTLIFSQWTSFLDRISDDLLKSGIKHLRLDGSTKNRQEIVEQFQTGDEYHVFLISIKAGGTGITLTAADHVIIMDPWWNPAVEDQAADRAHRIGQTRPVLIQKVVSKDTVEEKILELQARKKNLAESVLSGSGGALSITKQDLLDLF